MSCISFSSESGDLKLFDFCFQLVFLRSVHRVKAFKPNLIVFTTERHGEVAEMALTQVFVLIVVKFPAALQNIPNHHLNR